MLAGLDERERRQVFDLGTPLSFAPGEIVFHQGDSHRGIYIIQSGIVRSYYTGPSGREITLAYWAPGNFVGGPDIFGESQHMCSGIAERPSQVLSLGGAALRQLIRTIPGFALNMVEAQAHKGKCYSALIHMLGTRSVTERLAQLLMLMADLDGIRSADGLIIGRSLTHEELAKMVGATRQWITATLDRFREQGVILICKHQIILTDENKLRHLAGA